MGFFIKPTVARQEAKLWRLNSFLFHLEFVITANVILGSGDANDEQKDFSKIERSLTQELIEYMHTTVSYTIKRLLPADLKMIYVNSGNNNLNIEPNPFQSDFKSIPNVTKGGIHVTDNITYNW